MKCTMLHLNTLVSTGQLQLFNSQLPWLECGLYARRLVWYRSVLISCLCMFGRFSTNHGTPSQSPDSNSGERVNWTAISSQTNSDIAELRTFLDKVNRIVGSRKVLSFIPFAVLVWYLVAGRCSWVRVCRARAWAQSFKQNKIACNYTRQHISFIYFQ